ncbi:MAG: PAS domain S-box protein [Betaproteobacteria bacterium]|nr:PAS domain S-box protein [Betaproteobacteria bacterium]
MAVPMQALLPALAVLPSAATLQGADFRLIDANPAFSELVGRSRAALRGTDPLALEPPGSREGSAAERLELLDAAMAGVTLPPMQRRLVDQRGIDRWCSAAVSVLADENGQPLWLTVWHEVGAEVAARDQARRAHDELAQWFELSGTGMLVYDASGLIVRCNAAFEAMVEQVPEELPQAVSELQALLAWKGGALLPELVPGAPALETQAMVPLPNGRRRRLSARLVCQAAELGGRRVMAVVQDRSAEDARDLAQLEMGMLMDTASIGVATFDPTRGWLAPEPRRAPARQGDGIGVGRRRSGMLHGISRELVEPGSLPEFERLQKALRSGERTEVRYAVRHPELGPRWLLTRVEPGALAGGRATTSVVTLDVTEQESAQRRNEQLLHELTTILDSSNAGIAYLRGPVLVRCNRRFERMLGFAAGAAAGATLEEIFSRSVGMQQGAGQAVAALEQLDEGQPFEAELSLALSDGTLRWYSLSVRRAQADGDQTEAVAVLSDITRLKLQQTELEQLLRDRDLMFNLSVVGIVYQRGARIERANQAMALMTGWSSPELSTLDAVELYEDARACVDFEARIAQGLREQGRFGGERRLRRRDGSLLWVQVEVRSVHAEEPEAAVICSFVDIDERRRSRETLAGQAERTRAVLNSVLVGIVTVSDGGIQWMNRSARRMFGGELADFVGEPMSTVATPEPDHPLRQVGRLERLAEGQSETFECRLKARDGREFWVVGNAVLTGRGETKRELTVALLDIERRRQAEVHIAQAQASLQRVIETAPLAIALFDAATMRVQQLNQTAASFFGRPLEGLQGATLDDCAAPAQAAVLRDWLGQAVAGAGSRQHEWRERAAEGLGHGDGSASEIAARVWDCRITTLDDSAASVDAGGTQLLLVASDVTEQRVAERARLQAAIAQREVLVREVHHRIKNNLQGVAGLLQQNASRRPELAAILSEAVGQVQAIAQVYGLQVGASGPLVLASLLRAVSQSVQRTFGRPIAVDVDGDVPHMLPEAESIPVALTLNELFSNAIKHGHGGEVRCSLRVQGEAVHVTIASHATLAPGFDLDARRSAVSGLGLVRALLPRRNASLRVVQEGEDVVARLELRPPGVHLPARDTASG